MAEASEQKEDISKRPAFGNRYLTDNTKVFEHNAWDNVVWDDEQEQDARQKIKQQELTQASPQDREKYEKDADRYWNDFYSQHQNKFFKDRHWLFTEFPELLPKNSTASLGREHAKSEADGSTADSSHNKHASVSGSLEPEPLDGKSKGNHGHCVSDIDNLDLEECEKSSKVSSGVSEMNQESKCLSCSRTQKTEGDIFPGEHATYRILEIGCGAGNTVFPVLQTNNDPGLMMYCCDFSSNAVQLVKDHPEYDPRRCHAFVYDVTDNDMQIPFPENSLDLVIMVFVLSAILPDKMYSVIAKLSRFLKPGGMFLFRDYGRYDMAQLRFKAGRCLSENFYVRGDGTRVYFFTQDELKDMFTKSGLVEVQNLIDRRLQVNRGRQLKMYRVWVQCKYRKPKHAETETEIEKE
ncbi:hypothetical protein ScPMuIL_016059 [Solemya velum]